MLALHGLQKAKEEKTKEYVPNDVYYVETAPVFNAASMSGECLLPSPEHSDKCLHAGSPIPRGKAQQNQGDNRHVCMFVSHLSMFHAFFQHMCMLVLWAWPLFVPRLHLLLQELPAAPIRGAHFHLPAWLQVFHG